MRDLIQEVQALLAFAILRGVRKAVGQTELLPVVFAVHTDMDVVAVHVAVIAGVKVRLAIAEEHADLVAVAIGQFGTDEACVVVNVHVDGSAAGVNITPGTHTGSPQRGTVFEFSALSFAVGVSLILDHATHKSRIDDRGVLSSQMEVVGQRSQRIANLTLRCTDQICKDCAVGIGRQSICQINLVGRSSIGSCRVFATRKSCINTPLFFVDIDGRVKECVIGIYNGNVSTRKSIFSRHGTGHTFCLFVSLLENITIGSDNRNTGSVSKGQRTNRCVLSSNNTVGTALIDSYVNRVITFIGNVTLHGELVVIGCHNAEHAAIDNDLTITRSVFTNTEGALVTQQRTLFNSRAAAIGIVARHHERTGTALGERTVVQIAVDLGIDGSKTFIEILGSPGNCVFFADLFLVCIYTDDVIVGVKKNFTENFFLFFGQAFH